MRTLLLVVIVGTLATAVAALARRPAHPLPVEPTLVAAPAPHATPSAASRSRLRPVEKVYDVTAYTHTGYRTASGKWPEVGMVASNLWPLGARLKIEGMGEFVVMDRVGGGTDIDVFLPTRFSCIEFGRKHLHVRVIR